MKKQILGAIVLLAALVITGCGNKNQKKENTNDQNVTEVKAENQNRMLIIVDPQIDFTTGSLATANGPKAMDNLATAFNNGAWKKYNWIIVTQDAHPENHCSFVKEGGVFPPHCVQGTDGMKVYPALQEALNNINGIDLHYMQKGDLPEKEEFSIFQNALCGKKLTEIIEEIGFEGIDICGIATDYCVYETTKDLMAFYPAKQIRIVTDCIAAVDDNDTKLSDLMKENGIEEITFLGEN